MRFLAVFLVLVAPTQARAAGIDRDSLLSEAPAVPGGGQSPDAAVLPAFDVDDGPGLECCQLEQVDLARVHHAGDLVVCEGTSSGEHRDGPWRAGGTFRALPGVRLNGEEEEVRMANPQREQLRGKGEELVGKGRETVGRIQAAGRVAGIGGNSPTDYEGVADLIKAGARFITIQAFGLLRVGAELFRANVEEHLAQKTAV